MKQLTFLREESEQSNVVQLPVPPPSKPPKRRGPRKEVIRAKACLFLVMLYALKDYPNWSKSDIDTHDRYAKIIRRTGRLHQLPRTMAAIKEYAKWIHSEWQSRAQRAIQLAERWYIRGMSAEVRERKQDREQAGEQGA